MAAATTERFILGAYVSTRPALWGLLQDALALPFLVGGRVRRIPARADGEPVSVVCIGRQRRFRFLLVQLLSDVGAPIREEARCLWRRDALSRLGGHLTLAEVHPWLAGLFRRRAWRILPTFIRWRAPVAELPPARVSRSLRSNLKRTDKQGYSLEVVRHPTREDWQQFDRQMAEPYALRRFTGNAWLPSQTFTRQLEERGTLIFVARGARRLAGVCVIRARDKVWMPRLGVTDGDQHLARNGVITALYHGAIEWARESGAGWFDAGRTSPVWNDGIAAYKRSWGFTPSEDPLAPLIAFRIDPSHRGVARAFEREPVLISTGNGLRLFPAGDELR